MTGDGFCVNSLMFMPIEQHFTLGKKNTWSQEIQSVEMNFHQLIGFPTVVWIFF